MEKLGLDLSDQKQEARKLSIQRCIQSLAHACQCRGANCRLPSCQKMKMVVQHTKICKRKTKGGCPICKQLIALCCYHGKHCQETKCPVPFCLNIKHKLKMQQLQQRLQQARLLRRQIAVMNTRTSVPTSGLLGNSASGVLPGGAVSPASVMSGPQGACGMVVGIPSHQPGIGLKPGTQTPPANVLQVVKQLAGMQVQEEAARQQAPHAQVGYGKVNPPGVVVGQPQVMPPPQMQRTIQMGPSAGGPHLIPMDQWTPRYPSNPALQANQGLRQPSPNMIQPQQPLQVPPQQAQQPLGIIPSHIGADPSQQAPPGVVGAAGSNQVQKAVLQQLLQTLMSPNTPEQQQQILHVLKSNPQLMAAFIKQRQVYQQAQLSHHQ